MSGSNIPQVSAVTVTSLWNWNGYKLSFPKVPDEGILNKYIL